MSENKKLKLYLAQRTTELIRLEELKKIADKSLTDKSTHYNFKCRFRHLEAISENFQSINDNILGIVALQDGGDIETHHTILKQFENDLYHVQAIYAQLFEEQNDSTLNLNSTQTASSSKMQNVRLPKIELPKFGGDLRKWQTFIDMYDSLIHDNDTLSNIDKFNYLISSLENSALALVKRTPLTGQNYMVAYNSLKKRFDVKRLIASSHWHAIEQTKKLINTDDSQELHALLDTFNDNINMLENLGYDVKAWDFILFTMLFDRLDSNSATRFELEHGSNLVKDEYYKTLVEFVQKQCEAMDTVLFSNSDHNKKSSKSSSHSQVHNNFTLKRKVSSSLLVNSNKTVCQFCNGDHMIYSCPKFLAKSAEERFALVKEKRWCTNCLGSKHSSSKCSSSAVCRKCSSKHNTLLHFEKHSAPQPNSSNCENHVRNTNNINHTAVAESSGSSAPSINLFSSGKDNVLLCTALVEVLDSKGSFQKVRAVLDNGSQSNFMSKKCAKRLGLAFSDMNYSISGIGQITSQTSLAVSSKIKPTNSSEPIYSVKMIILPKICANIPNTNISVEQYNKFSNLNLADPTFNISQPVDILLGADIFASVLTGDFISGSESQPAAINTSLGWVLMGKVAGSTEHSLIENSLLVSTDMSLCDSVRRFWELEQLPGVSAMSPEEVIAEKHFESTFSRCESGRFKVFLPFKYSPNFEGSRDIALRRFFIQERRLMLNPTLYEQYKSFIEGYITSKYMEPVLPSELEAPSYYIPHLCVLRPDSCTTKIRVVFDASTKCNNGISLNDTLLTGPKLQRDISAILLRFRLYSVAFTSDIKSMFTQILVAEKHQDFQRILWRFSKNEEVQDFRLKTVTFGVCSSPYHAIRCLLQLSKEYKSELPLASSILESDVYVDDIVSSFPSIEEALLAQSQLISILKKAGFELRKWASNKSEVLSCLPTDTLQYDPLSMDFDCESTIKILGLQWNPSQDSFSYKISSFEKPCTKRSMLSQLARIYDPLGFLTPLTLYLKVLIQKLWALGMEWDKIPPADITEIWAQFSSEFKVLSKLQVPRIILLESCYNCELHGFCDASERGYAAVTYLKFIDSFNNSNIALVCAKSRAAPLKRISIPRLELCAALLLSDLIHFVKESLSPKIIISNLYTWSDSTVALAWIKSSPHRWATFVSNRVTMIQEKVAPCHWKYVKSSDNPADPASRGLSPAELIDCSLWWAGPPWLHLSVDEWPQYPHLETPSTDEEKRNIVLNASVEINPILNLLNKFSSISKIQRILGYVLRFFRNCKKSQTLKSGTLDITELENSLMSLIKCSQLNCFEKEISLLKSNKPLPKQFRKLTPFLDPQGILRVGGRLVHSNLPYEQKHPILLPSSHRLTDSIIEDTHKRFLHPGLQSLQYLLLQRYWILSPKRSIRRVISKCYKCFRVNPSSPQPIMGDLPIARISQVKPFCHTGIDMAGPFTITLKKMRGARTYKSYICIFVCMSTKAIHIELVSDLTTEAFLAAFRRFIARRGRCNHLYCDQGSNFVGASNYVSSLMENVSIEEKLQFHFNCPKAPNFGGLWEAGVKSIKTHLARVIGDQILTFEELYTVLTQIEAVLNSRPLCPLSTDPNDLQALTPGHFLTLEPLNALPDPDSSHMKISHIQRWTLLVHLHDSFWYRWHREYLHTLLQRAKWTDPSTPVKVNTMVLLKDESCSPLKWPLGRVTAVHPGSDGVTRVVSVNTSRGTFKRPVNKLCPLPYEE